MNKLLLSFIWVFSVTIAYWLGISQNLESQEELASVSSKPKAIQVKLEGNRNTMTNIGVIKKEGFKPVVNEFIIEAEEKVTIPRKSLFERMSSRYYLFKLICQLNNFHDLILY